MAGLAVVTALLALASPGWAAEQPNSASIAGVSWYPISMVPGYDVIVKVELKPGVELDHMEVVACRVQNYSCLAPIPVEGTPETDYAAVLKWNSSFTGPTAKQIGLEVTLTTMDGDVERSPLAPWPDAPSDAPQGTENKYYINVGPEPTSTPGSTTPGAPLLAAAACTLFTAWSLRLARRPKSSDES